MPGITIVILAIGVPLAYLLAVCIKNHFTKRQ